MSALSSADDEGVASYSVKVEPAEQQGAPNMVRVAKIGEEDGGWGGGAYPLQLVRGVSYPAWCGEQRWGMLQGSMGAMRSTDVLVVSYPKCGTTWAEQCVLLLQHACDVRRLNPASKNVYVPRLAPEFVGKIWPEACIEQNPAVHLKTGLEFVPITLDEFNAAPEPRTIKSHAPPHLLLTGVGQDGGIDSLPPGCKVVVVTRNPLDACVSSYYHAWNPSKSGWPFPAWAAAWLSGNVPHGSWFPWVKAWHEQAQRQPERVLWVQFEDLKTDPRETTRRVAAFLSPELGADDALIDAVVAASSFESMREQASSGDEGAAAGHLRKGVAGDWRNHFSPRLVADFQAAYEEQLRGTGIRFSLGPGEGFMG